MFIKVILKYFHAGMGIGVKKSFHATSNIWYVCFC